MDEFAYLTKELLQVLTRRHRVQLVETQLGHTVAAQLFVDDVRLGGELEHEEDGELVDVATNERHEALDGLLGHELELLEYKDNRVGCCTLFVLLASLIVRSTQPYF